MSCRKGANVDSDNLEELFNQLGFKVQQWSSCSSPSFTKQVEKHLNLTRNETLRTLIDFTDRKEHELADMVTQQHVLPLVDIM